MTTPNSNDRLFRSLINEDGRFRVAAEPRTYALASGDLAAVNTSLAIEVSDVSNAVFHVYNAGVGTGACGTVAFEASLDSTDGTDGRWFSIQAAVSNSNTAVTAVNIGTLAAGAPSPVSWECSVNALPWVRIRQTVANTANTVPRWSAQRGTYATEPLPVVQSHAITGSVTSTPVSPTTTFVNSAATTNATLVRNAACTLHGLSVTNTNAAARYLKLYNKASAPEVGTDVPVLTIRLPPLGEQITMNMGGTLGLRFLTGLGLALTVGAADSDTAAVAASEIKLGVSWV